MRFAAARAAIAPALREVFGSAAIYTAPGGAPQSIRAVYDAAHEVVSYPDGVPVSATQPVLDVLLSDLAAPPVRGASVEVEGETYEVADVQPDGHGWALLRLVRP